MGRRVKLRWMLYYAKVTTKFLAKEISAEFQNGTACWIAKECAGLLRFKSRISIYTYSGTSHHSFLMYLAVTGQYDNGRVCKHN